MAGRSNRKKEALEASTAIEAVLKSDIQAEEAALTPEQEKELADCAERLVALGRRSTVQAFDYGEELARAQAILPPKKYGKWVKANCGISTRAAKNYTRVYNELASYRDRLENVAAAPTAMFALLGAEGDAVEAVLDAFENGERLTVAKIKSMACTAENGETPEVNALDMPGRAGALKIAEQRMKSNLALFYELLAKALVHVEKAAAVFEGGKRPVKADLVAAIEIDCRHANDLFGLTLAPLFMNSIDPRFNWRSSECEATSGWGRLQVALRTAGGRDSWPTGDAFKPWIVEELHPLLRFAVCGTPLDAEHKSDKAGTIDIQAREEARDLKATRIRLDATPELQSDNVVELASRQKRAAAEAIET